MRVVLIAVDTLRADHLGIYGAVPSPSPLLDARAKHGVVFEWAFATSPWTLPSFGSLLTGLDPGTHEAGIILRNHPDRAAERERVGPRSRLKLNPSIPTLAERLSAAGLTTIALVQSPNLDPAFGLDRGFDNYEHQHANNEQIVPADVVIDRALEIIDEHRNTPLFLLVHLFEPHLDYHAPAPFGGSLSGSKPAPAARGKRGESARPEPSERTLPVSGVQRLRRTSRSLSEERKRFIRAAYDEEISFVDREIERFFIGLEARDIDDEVIVILTSDHGEEFFEHGDKGHEKTLFDEVVRVPLLFHWPTRIRDGIRVATQVRLIDVMPTLLSLAGVAVADEVHGRDLSSALFGGPLPATPALLELHMLGRRTLALRTDEWVVIAERQGSPTLYDLRRDPMQQEPLGNEDPRHADAVRALYREASRAREYLRGHPPGSAKAEVSPLTRRRLEALGYAEGGEGYAEP